jgi:hypothetical protein
LNTDLEPYSAGGVQNIALSETSEGVMIRFRKAAIVCGAASMIVALVGVMLMMTQPAQSKDDRTRSASDGVMTQLGF